MWNPFKKEQPRVLITEDELTRTLRAFQVQLTTIEEKVDRQAIRVRQLENTTRGGAYIGEVSDLMAALGPAAFKGAVKTCFALPQEVMRAKGDSSALRDALENSTAALDRAQSSVTDLARQNLELKQQFLELEREVIHKMASGQPNGDARKQLS